MKDSWPRSAVLPDGVCPCCGPAPDVQIQLLSIDGEQVGIIGLRQIVAEVKVLGPADESEIKNELLERVERRNYFVPSATESYRQALWQEYRRRP